MRHLPHRAFLAIVVALAFAPPAQAGKADKRAVNGAGRPLIETSYLIAPERIGDFALEGARYDDRNKYAGAGFRYALKDHQETRFDVFVYPAGRAPQADAITSGMAEFRADIEQSQVLGAIRDLQILSEDDFPLQPAESAGSTDTPPEQAPAVDAGLLEAIASTRTVGKRLRMHNTMVDGGFPMASNGYLVHRQLYFFKVRASAARDRIDQAAFDALTDRAARELVQAIEVANVGGCATAEIAIDPDGSPDEMVRVLVRRTAEIQAENCFSDAGKAGLEEKSKNARVVRIDFIASDWKAR